MISDVVPGRGNNSNLEHTNLILEIRLELELGLGLRLGLWLIRINPNPKSNHNPSLISRIEFVYIGFTEREIIIRNLANSTSGCCMLLSVGSDTKISHQNYRRGATIAHVLRSASL